MLTLFNTGSSHLPLYAIIIFVSSGGWIVGEVIYTNDVSNLIAPSRPTAVVATAAAASPASAAGITFYLSLLLSVALCTHKTQLNTLTHPVNTHYEHKLC